MVYDAQLPFDDTVAYNRLFTDLQVDITSTGIPQSAIILNGEQYFVNLKELRDQLVGRRCGNGIVFTWGLANYGRLGVLLSDQQRKQLNSENHEEQLILKPSVVKFPDSRTIIIKVACGSSFTLALSSDGLVYSWGLGSCGGLGLGEVSMIMTPQQIKIDKNGLPFAGIKDISCGANHCLAVDSTMTKLYSWGSGLSGRLGHGDETGENVPKEVVFFRQNAIKIQVIEAGEQSSAVVSSKNHLYIWGSGLYGRLGTGKTGNILTPYFLEELKNVKVEIVSLGSNHTLCLLRNGKVLCWGQSKDGKLGIDSALDRNFLSPKELIALEKEKIFQLSAGPFHSLILSESGTLFAFGNSRDGKLGFEDKANVHLPKALKGINFSKKYEIVGESKQKYPLFTDYDSTSVLVPSPDQDQQVASEILQVSCGNKSTVMLMNDGTIISFGSNQYGQLGCMKVDSQYTPDLESSSFNPKQVGNQTKRLMLGEETPLDDDQYIPANVKRKLQDLKQLNNTDMPQRISLSSDSVQHRVKFICAGAFHVLAITQEGHTFAWGRNDFGQLGIGKKEAIIASPQRVKFFADKIIVMAAAGENHSLFLRDQGDVYACGFNEYGQLGIGGAASKEYDQDIAVSQAAVVNPQEDVLGEVQQRLLESKIELTPKLVRGLESIGYIAAGKNHSVAIRSQQRKEKELQMYTWGAGWDGQLGLDNWENEPEPKQINSNSMTETKFIMAACGAKHTIALDVSGNMWYFGLNSSVGIVSDQQKQLSPCLLNISQGLKKEQFKFVASGDFHNLAITTKSQVYGFGKNQPYSLLQSIKKEFIQTKLASFEQGVTYVACGPQHTIVCDQSRLPYSWGNLSNGRCGHPQSADIKDKSSISNILGKTALSQIDPTRIQETPLLIERVADILQIKVRKQGVEKEEKQQRLPKKVENNFRFPIQKILKENPETFNEGLLVTQDQSIEQSFQRLISDYHKSLSVKNEVFLNSFYSAQNSIISRILTFPLFTKNGQGVGGLPRLTEVKTELPKVIIRNKQLFEALFTQLQVHPCYLINWVTKTSINRQSKEVVRLVEAVFGRREILNNNRIIHILMVVARKQLAHELKTFDLKEILWGRTDSVFVKVFDLIFINQSQNMQFIRSLICTILHKIQKFIIQLTNPNNRYGIRVINKSELKFQLDYESNADVEIAYSRVRMLVDLLKEILAKIKQTLEPQFKSSGFGFLSDEVFSLLAIAKEDLTAKAEISGQARDSKFTQELDVYLNNLVFSHIFKALRSLTAEQITHQYWGQLPEKEKKRPEPVIDMFDMESRKFIIPLLTEHIEKYLAHSKLPYNGIGVELLGEMFDSHNTRRDLAERLTKSNVDFDMLLIKDLFLNSMEQADSNVTISIRDIIYVYNTLLDQGGLILQDSFDEDPIRIILDSLGRKPIELFKNERPLISEDVLDLKVNLQIKHRLMIGHGEFVKCGGCGAPAHDDMVRFNIGDAQWKCKMCSIRNPTKEMQCTGCRSFRPRESMPESLMLQRYFRKNDDNTLDVFIKILQILPPIDRKASASIDEMIDAEASLEEASDAPDYAKLQMFDRFKKIKHDYIQLHRHKTSQLDFVPSDDPNHDKTTYRLHEAAFLAKLESDLTTLYEDCKAHRELQTRYMAMIRELNEKLETTYTQRHQISLEEFKQISANAHHGRGSDFLKGQQRDVIAGRLHILIGGDKQKQEGGQRNEELEQFYRQMEKNNGNVKSALMAPEPKITIVQKKGVGIYGKYPLYLLRNRKVLVEIEIEGKKLDSVLKKSSFVFYDDGDYGFRVDLIYEESDTKCLIFGMVSHEAIIESFKIEKHMLAEMRRTFTTKARIQFGSALFNVFELVILLNEVRSKTFVLEKPIGMPRQFPDEKAAFANQI